MAEEQEEEIIIIEEADASGIESPNTADETTPSSSPSSVNKKKVILMAGALSALLLGGGIAFTLLSHPSDKTIKYESNLLPSVNSEEPKIEPSELEHMIERANFLYANGSQAEALKLYEKIALYSEAISQYNLGVVQLKEQEYEGALENFKRSIAGSENRCVSAINAAVCCLHLKQEENFNYYIDLAHAYLSAESNSPMYSYYYSLINYYKGHYLEALSALNHPTTNEYQLTQNKLKAKIATLYGDYATAIKALENPLQEINAFTLGALYANTGNLQKAREYLNIAIMHNKKPLEESLSLVYVNLKLGLHEEAAEILNKLTSDYPDDIYTLYPIKISLKDGLFQPNTIQRLYRSVNAKFQPQTYQKLFALAPYKIFNATQTLGMIQKGNANLYIDDTSSAKEYLSKGANTSEIDYGIAIGIDKALHYRLTDANEQFKRLQLKNPQHSILNYNLALTYAQQGDFSKAYDYFLRSYHLDANNYLSGIFAIMTSELINKPDVKLMTVLSENLSQEPKTEEFDLYRTLISMREKNYAAAGRWLENNYKDRPLYLGMKVIIASELGMDSKARKASEKLITMKPNDLLPHLLYIDTHFNENPPKQYARSCINYLKKQNFSYDDFDFGPQIIRDRYILMAALTGSLTPVIQRLEQKLQTTPDNRASITTALALAHFYNQDFEKSYALYNNAIDKFSIKDEKTFYMGALASIGAGHYQNAISLFQLSKMINPDYLESRYALGLLYLQVQNNPAAVVQFTKMKNNGFKSRTFDFKIDTDKFVTEPYQYPLL
ncbi:MAG: tetratricopeptide repeat protein [Sulfuricurvum sp.]|nr:tetratricopeptide repeat protein [Sulfuricurvum sp.]MDP3022637.1 tetratricopeptide repeat protein [Sulfuricurvum sp.]